MRLSRRSQACLAALIWLALGATTLWARPQAPARRPTFDPSVRELVSDDLWKAANHDRVPFRDDGYFAFPRAVKAVVVDVGAYKLKRTKRWLGARKNVGIVAIEPMSEPWATWPNDRRVIGVPVAVSLERGALDFNVNKVSDTSSLLDTVPGNVFEEFTETVEIRKVPGVRLSDVMERIHPRLNVLLLKTDVQGMDLAVLRSAGPHLKRTHEVRTEIMKEAAYREDRDGAMGTEKDFHSFMDSMGFDVAKVIATPNDWWLDAIYANRKFRPARAEPDGTPE